MFLISRPFFDFAGTIRSVAGSTQCSLEKKMYLYMYMLYLYYHLGRGQEIRHGSVQMLVRVRRLMQCCSST